MRRSDRRGGWRDIVSMAAGAMLLAATASGCGSDSASADVQRSSFFQASTLGALNIGIFEGELTIGELKRQGDFGLGTFDALDGEMVVLDGVVFRVGTDGVPRAVADDATTPFAAVVHFAADLSFELAAPLSFAALQQEIDARLSTFNLPVAVKVSGRLPSMRARSVPRQSQPYPPLAVAVEEQTVFDLSNVQGTLVGFRTPKYLANVNAAGYHFHFVSDDRRAGGHVLDVTAGPVLVEIEYLHDFHMQLPSNAAFADADLDPPPCAASALIQP